MNDTATTDTPPDVDPPQPGVWQLDPAHSSVEAVARHMMVTKVRGRFTDFSGEVRVGEDVDSSSVTATIQAASIDTNEPDRDEHLRSADFLDVDNHPTLTFTSTDIAHVDGRTWQVTGDLTIRGETRSVTLDVEYLGVNTDPFGQERALFSATTELVREDWGMTWNQPLDTGGVLVSKKLDVEIEVSAIREGGDQSQE